MMKFRLIIIFFIYSSFAYSQVDIDGIVNFYDVRSKYIVNPKNDDTTCINSINKAKQDIKNGKIVFCTPVGFLFGSLRFENELNEVVEYYGLSFKVDLISDVIFEGQTGGCYGAFMTNYIKQKFGNHFREKVYQEADSLYIKNVINKNKIVDCWDCDVVPHLPNKKPIKDYSITLNIDSLQLPVDCSKTVLIDFDFIIELDSTTNNYNVYNQVFGTNENEKYSQKLINYSIYELMKIEKWCPGQLGNSNVRTRQYVRVYFSKEEN